MIIIPLPHLVFQLKEINSRLDKIEPKAPPSDGARTQYRAMERSVSAHPKRGSPRKKNTSRESTLFGGKFYFVILDDSI